MDKLIGTSGDQRSTRKKYRTSHIRILWLLIRHLMPRLVNKIEDYLLLKLSKLFVKWGN
jgi:hypothetical protein